MTNKEFQSWLKGFFELSGTDILLNNEQMKVITSHLNLAEAVTGALDGVNHQIRAHISAFRSIPAPQTEDFIAVTEAIQKTVS
jgi:hypothetical protein